MESGRPEPPALVPLARLSLLDHLAARLLALAALLGALLHHRVGRVLGALVAAPLARVGARGADQLRHRPVLRGDPRRRLAHGGAVLAEPECDLVLLLPLGEQPGAV